jgi:hypothetical protein
MKSVLRATHYDKAHAKGKKSPRTSHACLLLCMLCACELSAIGGSVSPAPQLAVPPSHRQVSRRLGQRSISQLQKMAHRQSLADVIGQLRHAFPEGRHVAHCRKQLQQSTTIQVIQCM